MIRKYKIIHDPHSHYARGAIVTAEEIRELLAQNAGSGLELSDGKKTYRIYQGRFYLLDQNGWMWNLRIPKTEVAHAA